ncbi:hypothetical protein BT96DRAFT_990308 [Gymnopus androsaceus JB14]|uniref:Uncharacterized protein n=1 Tax=Gymnopus androsaceus JB14 TaxID=1447944 RepID=A0A6A4HVX8_9AGAR|nr:hypothetical protein BT96DRAFT_990308 [Gymnopus androsaceus JB14]
MSLLSSYHKHHIYLILTLPPSPPKPPKNTLHFPYTGISRRPYTVVHDEDLDREDVEVGLDGLKEESDSRRPSSSVNDDGILHPKAFQRAKTFLKTVLQNEVDALSEYGDKALRYNLVQTRYHRKDELVEAFKSQLLTFGRDQFPFKSGRNKDTDPLKWWKHLTQDENADVLATINVKIFAVLPNSMPDECTVSEFTRQNSALRGNQSVSTLVDIVQVGQWYKVHSPRIAGEPVKLRRRPVVKFWDMTKELQNGGEADSERDEDSSDEEDVAECSVADWEVSDTAFALDEDVDLAAPVLCDMISETGPPIGDQSNAKGKASSTTIQSSSKPDVPDYDF